MTARAYLLRGQPVTLLALAKPRPGLATVLLGDRRRGIQLIYSPRNALIQHADGTVTARPFRGLRRIPNQKGAA